MQDYETRYRKAVQIALDSGLRKGTVEPPLLKIVRSWGKQIKPPVYASFSEIFTHYSLVFGTLWALIMFFVFWQHGGTPALEIVLTTLIVGTALGGLVAGYFRWMAHRHNLPSWSEL